MHATEPSGYNKDLELRKNPFLLNIFIASLVLAYVFALIMSTAHLSRLYKQFDENLTLFGGFDISLGLAIALEFTAFVLSMISTYLTSKVSRWATIGSVLSLGLVWFGNFYSMQLAGTQFHPVIVFVFSLFVPICTYIVGKVLGDLIKFKDYEAYIKDQGHLDHEREQVQNVPLAIAAEVPVEAPVLQPRNPETLNSQRQEVEAPVRQGREARGETLEAIMHRSWENPQAGPEVPQKPLQPDLQEPDLNAEPDQVRPAGPVTAQAPESEPVVARVPVVSPEVRVPERMPLSQHSAETRVKPVFTQDPGLRAQLDRKWQQAKPDLPAHDTTPDPTRTSGKPETSAQKETLGQQVPDQNSTIAPRKLSATPATVQEQSGQSKKLSATDAQPHKNSGSQVQSEKTSGQDVTPSETLPAEKQKVVAVYGNSLDEKIISYLRNSENTAPIEDISARLNTSVEELRIWLNKLARKKKVKVEGSLITLL